MITGLAHVCFTVKDLPTAEAFYVRTLGFTHAFDFADKDGRKFGTYLHISGRTFLELFAGTVSTPAPGQSFRHICLEVDDIERTVADLRAQGVRTDDPRLGADGSYQAWLEDPDGNRIELHHYTPQSRQSPWLK